jgi:ketosteroid isomerase-like protein
VSEENVALAKALFEGATSDLDKNELLAMLPQAIPLAFDPEIEWIEDPSRADGRVYRGHDGVLQSFERWFEQWDDYRMEPERFVDCGDRVLVTATEHGRGATSGATVSAHIHMVLTFRNGKILRYQEFYDESAAEAAAGLG